MTIDLNPLVEPLHLRAFRDLPWQLLTHGDEGEPIEPPLHMVYVYTAWLPYTNTWSVVGVFSTKTKAKKCRADDPRPTGPVVAFMVPATSSRKPEEEEQS